MSIRGWLGRQIMRRIEESPRVQEQQARTDRLWPFVSAARDAAFTNATDEQARDELLALTDLRSKLESESAGVWDAVEWLGRDRRDYIADRAYRLLTAAVAGTAVRPIDPAVAVLFGREERLGRMPMQHAYAELAALEPRLLDVRERVAASPAPPPGPTRWPNPVAADALRGVLGVANHDGDQLLRTDLAHSLALHYLSILVDGRFGGDPATAYFDAPTKASVGGVTLFGPQRPRAQN